MKRAGVKGEIRRNSLIVCRYACKLSMFLNLGSYLPYLMTVHLALYCLTLCLVITFCSLLIFAQGFYRGRGPFYKTLVFIDVLTTEEKFTETYNYVLINFTTVFCIPYSEDGVWRLLAIIKKKDVFE